MAQRAPTLIEIRSYIGANVHCGFPAVVGTLELIGDPAENFTVVKKVQQHLVAYWSEISTDHPAFAAALPESDFSVALLIARVAEELQNVADAGISGADAGRRSSNTIFAICAYQDQRAGVAALRLAHALVTQAWQFAQNIEGASSNISLQLRQQINAYLGTARNLLHLDQTTRDITVAAQARGIPCLRVSMAGRFMQLGQGVHLQHIFESCTSQTSHIGSKLSHNKIATHHLLKSLGVPTPEQIVVETNEQAYAAARHFGYPVVVKPSHGAKSTGVTTDIKNDLELSAAVQHTANAGLGNVLVERHVPGDGYRLLAVDGKLIAAALVIPTHVVGDGIHTVEQLVDIINQDPRRGLGFSKEMVRITLDATADRMLAIEGFERASVPPSGHTVYLNNLANIGTGGIARDVTDIVHSDVHEMVALISYALKLDIMGIDYLTTDISRSPAESGGAVCDVNTTPGLRTHWVAGSDKTKVLGAILDLHYGTHDGRIPVIAVCGAGENQELITTLAKEVAHRWQASGKTVVCATTNGVWIGTRKMLTGPLNGTETTRATFLHPEVEAAVFGLDYADILKSGVPFDRCDVAVWLGDDDVASNRDEIETAAVMRTLFNTATRAAILRGHLPIGKTAKDLCVPIVPIPSNAGTLILATAILDTLNSELAKESRF